MAHLPGTPTTQLNTASYGWGSKFSPPQLRCVLILYKNSMVIFARQQYAALLLQKSTAHPFSNTHSSVHTSSVSDSVLAAVSKSLQTHDRQCCPRGGTALLQILLPCHPQHCDAWISRRESKDCPFSHIAIEKLKRNSLGAECLLGAEHLFLLEGCTAQGSREISLVLRHIL